MKEKFKKLGALLPALGVAVLTGLSQVTISGANVWLENTDVSAISTAMSQWFSGMLWNIVMLWPVLALITFAWMAIKFIAKKFRAR